MTRAPSGDGLQPSGARATFSPGPNLNEPSTAVSDVRHDRARPAGRVGRRDRRQADDPRPRPQGRRPGHPPGERHRELEGRRRLHPAGDQRHPKPRGRVRRLGAGDPEAGHLADLGGAPRGGGPGRHPRPRQARPVDLLRLPAEPGRLSVLPGAAEHREPAGRNARPVWPDPAGQADGGEARKPTGRRRLPVP